MKRKRFNEAQIIGVLREAEAGGKKQDFCRKYGLNEQTFCSRSLTPSIDEIEFSQSSAGLPIVQSGIHAVAITQSFL